MASVGSDRKGLRVQCSAHRESSTCDNGRRVYLVEIESLVVTTLRKHLDHPAVIAEYVTAYNEERKRLRRQAGNDLARLTRREAEIGRELARLIDSIAKACRPRPSPRIRELNNERTGVALAINQFAGSREHRRAAPVGDQPL